MRARKPPPPKDNVKCLVCGKPTTIADRNSDGTYAHRECLYTVQQR